MKFTKILLLIAACGLAACGSSDDSSEAVACETSSECGSDVCVRVGSASTCAPKCSVSANECSGGASCQGLGSLEVNVCAEKPKDPAQPKVEEQPRVACKTDSDCSSLDSRAICAQWKGVRDCSVPCTANDQCNPPSVDGITKIEFYSCQPDEGQTTRNVCLPREECLTNPASCVTVTIPDDGGGTGGFNGFGGSF